jgi:hypothetical protein
MLNAAQTNWDELINDCVFIYRTTISRVLDDSPFYMLYARDPVLPQDLAYPLRRHPVNNISDPLQNYKEYYDRKHKQVDFHVNDLVMIYFPATKIGKTYKFLAKWDGPYKVLAKINDVNYRVASLAQDKILAVHVQRMLKYTPWKY